MASCGSAIGVVGATSAYACQSSGPRIYPGIDVPARWDNASDVALATVTAVGDGWIEANITMVGKGQVPTHISNPWLKQKSCGYDGEYGLRDIYQVGQRVVITGESGTFRAEPAERSAFTEAQLRAFTDPVATAAGSGPVAAVVGGWVGRDSLTLLDDHGQTVGRVAGTVTPDVIVACPGGQRVVVAGTKATGSDITAGWGQPSGDFNIEVIDIAQRKVVRTAPLNSLQWRDHYQPGLIDYPWSVTCADPAAERVLVAAPNTVDDSFPQWVDGSIWPEAPIDGVTVVRAPDWSAAVWNESVRSMVFLRDGLTPQLAIVDGATGSLASKVQLDAGNTRAEYLTTFATTPRVAALLTPRDEHDLDSSGQSFAFVDISDPMAPRIEKVKATPASGLAQPIAMNPDGSLSTSLPRNDIGLVTRDRPVSAAPVVDPPPSMTTGGTNPRPRWAWTPDLTPLGGGTFVRYTSAALTPNFEQGPTSSLRWIPRDGSPPTDPFPGVAVLGVVALPGTGGVQLPSPDVFWPDDRWPKDVALSLKLDFQHDPKFAAQTQSLAESPSLVPPFLAAAAALLLPALLVAGVMAVHRRRSQERLRTPTKSSGRQPAGTR